ncbi:helix-turn-helix domain-containing protein [Streptomyces sp. NPDC051578]|uniref:helix-turn-helix domain-containing protein n=1 Tax=Streptomyces sp. NPDC051578 TaxID=3365662 RepID=UPI0037A3B843
MGRFGPPPPGAGRQVLDTRLISTQERTLLEQPGFGRRLRQLRQQQGKSQADLTGPGMSATYLSRLESGARRPTDRAVAYLSEKLGVPLRTLAEQPEDSLADVVATIASLSERELDAETGRILSEALRSDPGSDPMTRWHGLTQLGRVYEVVGDSPAQRDALTELTALGEELGRPALQVRARIWMARCARDVGDAGAARQAVREALALSEQHHLRISASDRVRSKLVLVSAEAELGDLAEAARLSDEVCEALESTRGTLAAEAYWTAATVSTRQGNHPRALARLMEALAAIDSRDDLMLWIRLRLAAASLSIQAMPARLDDAQSYLDSVEPALELTGTARHLQELLFLKAKLAFHQGDIDRATELAARAKEGASLLSYRDQVRYEVLEGLLAMYAGDPDARRRLTDLAAKVQTANMPDLAAEVWRTVAENSGR